jgi:enolase
VRIQLVRGREILDSRGRPTVEADVELDDGTVGRAAAPSGSSTGRHEARELRDEDPARYRGHGVLAAVANVTGRIGPALRGRDPADQTGVDARLLELDGTPDKHVLGANATTAVSLAVARAAASGRRLPLYRHVAELAGVREPRLPLPMFNIISGGLHAGRQLDIQDVLVMPAGATSFRDALELAVEVHARVGDRVVAEGRPPLVADEGGWAPPLGTNEAAIAWVGEAARGVAHDRGSEVVLALDVAASHVLGDDGTYRLAADGAARDARGMIALLARWAAAFPVASIEDGLGEDDWAGWQELTSTLGDAVQVVGDDLFVTDAARLRHGIELRAANAVLVKVNQAGTLSEALTVVRVARRAGFRVIVSARSGETEDAFLADLAVGVAADQVKVGSVTRSSRLAKWNQLLRIEEELGPDAYAGASGLRAVRPD